MLDIHSHLLPAVDDGSDSPETSIRLLREAIRCGVTDLIVTPHYCPARGYTPTAAELREAFDRLTAEADRQKLPIRLYLGEEIYCSEWDNIIAKLDRGELLTLNGSPYVLLEFSPVKEPDHLPDLLYNLSVHGYVPVLAHVERYSWMNIPQAVAQKEEGALLQINASSLTSWKYRKRCHKLLKEKLVDFVASDAHASRKHSFEKLSVLQADRFLCRDILETNTGGETGL